MSAIVISGFDVLKVTLNGEKLTLCVVAHQETAIISAASFRADGLYFVSKSEPKVLYKWRFTEKPVAVATLPFPAKKVVFYRNKVYCSLAGSMSILCVDPLYKSVELLPIKHEVLNFEPADHGFVVESESGELFGYHFNNGVAKVTGYPRAVLLGSYKSSAIAAFCNNTGNLRVLETGAVSQACISVKNNPFVSFNGEAVLELNSLRRLNLGSITTLVPGDGEVHLLHVPDLSAEDECTLCFCEFGDDDSISLDCGHRFHIECVMRWVQHWDDFRAEGNHIVFTHAVCPGGCKHLIRHASLSDISSKIGDLRKLVKALSNTVLPLIPTKTEDDLLFYMCAKCQKPFFGGEKVCSRIQGGEPKKDPKDLLCETCKDDFVCLSHRREFVVYKCNFCCNPATHLSFGTLYMCNACDSRWIGRTEIDPIACSQDSSCPLGGHHASTSFPIGCLLCMTEGTINFDAIPPTH